MVIYWGYPARGWDRADKMRLTLSIDRKIEIVNVAVLAEDLVEVVFVDILRQSLDHNLHNFQLVTELLQLRQAGYFEETGMACLCRRLLQRTLATGPAARMGSIPTVASATRVTPRTGTTAAWCAARGATAAVATATVFAIPSWGANMTVSVVGTAAAHRRRRAGMVRVWCSGSGTGAGGLVESHGLGFPNRRVHGCVEGSTTGGASESNGVGGRWVGA